MKININIWDGSHYRDLGFYEFDSMKPSLDKDVLVLNVDEIKKGD